AVSTRAIRLPGRSGPLALACGRIRVPPRHRRLPALPAGSLGRATEPSGEERPDLPDLGDAQDPHDQGVDSGARGDREPDRDDLRPEGDAERPVEYPPNAVAHAAERGGGDEHPPDGVERATPVDPAQLAAQDERLGGRHADGTG